MKGLTIFFCLCSLIFLASAKVHRRKAAAPKKYPAKIHFSANDIAAVYFNGRRKGVAKSWKRVKVVNLRVRDGDVIAFKAINKRGSYGFIADIEINGKHYPTGGEGWKAAHGGVKGSTWMKARKGFCWHKPMGVLETRYKKCQNFPYRFGAKYVWACHSSPGSRSVTLLRFVVGGDGCPPDSSSRAGPSPTASPTPTSTPTPTPTSTPAATTTPTPSPSPVSVTINGAGDPDDKLSCKCEEIQSSGGVCYYFQDPSIKRGRCYTRPCGTRFVCVVNGSMICMKKNKLEKVVALAETGDKECTTVATDEPIWLPYGSQ